MVLALAVNSEKSSLTQGRATQFIGMRLYTLRMLATLSPQREGNIIMLVNQDSAATPCVVWASGEDARTDDASRLSDHPRFAGAAGIQRRVISIQLHSSECHRHECALVSVEEAQALACW